jgi:surface protein
MDVRLHACAFLAAALVFTFASTVKAAVGDEFAVSASTALHDHFVTTWKTDNPGSSNNTSITVPIFGGPYDVDWDNDGTFDQTGLTDPVTHNFGVAGTYTIRIGGVFDFFSFFPPADPKKLLSIDQWGTNIWSSMYRAFDGASNLQVFATDTPDLSNVTSMHAMFRGAGLADPDTSGWDTSAVTNMSYMFSHAHSANPDTSTWDTSAVTNMRAMFWDAIVANPDTSAWNTASVTDMGVMFSGADSANPDTSGWDTSSVTSMSNMFLDAGSANPDTSAWDTSSVTDMNSMFSYATSANPDTSAWDTSSVISMASMFKRANNANPDTSNWNTGSVTDMRWMFWNANLANPDTSGWDTSSLEEMSYMFVGATSFDQAIGHWNVSSLEDAVGMFRNASLSASNYEDLLIGWNGQVLQPGVVFDGGNSTFCSPEAVAARANIITTYGWTITDGGGDETCASAPDSPSIPPDLIPESDTGVSDSDNFTTDNTPDFFVECSSAGNIITLYTDNPTAGMPFGGVECLYPGTQIAPALFPLKFGTHNISYTEQNDSGESGHSPTLEIMMDTITIGGFE